MTVWIAFLRAINVGKRQMKMGELKALCAGLGFEQVKTILASGNVRFEADGDPRARLEAGIAARWGWTSEAAMRSAAEIEAMLGSAPFAAYAEDERYQRYVLMFDRPLPAHTQPTGIAGDFDVVRVDEREVYLVGYRQPDGRHGPGMDKLDRQFDKGMIATSRNWKTIPKVLM